MSLEIVCMLATTSHFICFASILIWICVKFIILMLQAHMNTWFFHDESFNPRIFRQMHTKITWKFLAQNRSQNFVDWPLMETKHSTSAHTDSSPHALSSHRSALCLRQFWEMRCCCTTVPLSVCCVDRLLVRIQQSHVLTLFFLIFISICLRWIGYHFTILIESCFFFHFLLCLPRHKMKIHLETQEAENIKMTECLLCIKLELNTMKWFTNKLTHSRAIGTIFQF